MLLVKIRMVTMRPTISPEARQIFISPRPDAALNALAAFVSVRSGDTIEFGCGYFDIKSTLLLTGRLAESVTIKGCGIDETVLLFRNSPGVEGLLMGRYGIYPVKSRNILVDRSESIGASDAGIYVGQTSIAKITNSRAAFNVFGFEIENVRHGEYSDNLGECNTGAFFMENAMAQPKLILFDLLTVNCTNELVKPS
jgi:hypothetical protein